MWAYVCLFERAWLLCGQFSLLDEFIKCVVTIEYSGFDQNEIAAGRYGENGYLYYNIHPPRNLKPAASVSETYVGMIKKYAHMINCKCSATV